MKLKERLKELRAERNLTLEQLAKKTQLSRASLSFWEKGERMPSAYVIYVLAKYYDVSADYILGLID